MKDQQVQELQRRFRREKAKVNTPKYIVENCIENLFFAKMLFKVCFFNFANILLNLNEFPV